MSVLSTIKKEFIDCIKSLFALKDDQIENVEIILNIDKEKSFGDLNCNAAMVLAKVLQKNPREIATQIKDSFLGLQNKYVKDVQIAGPGFLNIFLEDKAYQDIAIELYEQKENYFKLDKKLYKL